MKQIIHNVRQVLRGMARDERGGEIIEYALILGLIIVAAIGMIAAFGTAVAGRWTSVETSFK